MVSWPKILASISLASFFAFFFLNSGCENGLLQEYHQTIVPNPENSEFLFCFWNVENLFDDIDDHRTHPGDREWDKFFSDQPNLLMFRLAKLADAFMHMNEGKGPDIIALAEVESERAAYLLQITLNQKIENEELHYRYLVMKEAGSGRHISTAILSRIPVIPERTRLHGNQLRILEGHFQVGDHPLVIFASHWTSRLRDASENGRIEYANRIYAACNSYYQRNRKVDILVAGDFNDSPQDISVTRHLRATGDLSQLQMHSSGPLNLLNLMANKDPSAGHGTYYYHRWYIFDQIAVSPGMLDQTGWVVDPESVQVGNWLAFPSDPYPHKRPWRFGGPQETGPRGFSDHFPVLVKLKLFP